LEEGFVLTNEPGCYFIDTLLDKALQDPVQSYYIDNNILSRFRGFGGVRLEDDIIITSLGVDNMTLCPRTVKEIEDVLAGGVWPPILDEAPELRRKWVKLAENFESMEVDIIPLKKTQ
jgi:Xaa-Pro dipeptidase